VVLRNLDGVNRKDDVRLLLIPVRLPWKKLGGDALVYRDVAANEDDEDVNGLDCNQSFTSGLLLINELMDGVTDSIVDASSRYDSETFVPTDASLDIRCFVVDADVVNFDVVGGASLDILLSLHDVVDMDDCKLTAVEGGGGGGLAASKLALCREIALLIALPSEDMYSSSSSSSSQL